MTKILAGHTSPETAYVVDDYPYGFRLRCKIRYWLETNKRGTRFCSQTTNPKAKQIQPANVDGNSPINESTTGHYFKVQDVWNKPKASTYAEFSGAMYLDENNHVQWASIGQYSDADACTKYLATFGENASNYAETKRIVRLKEIFEEELNRFNPRPSYGTELFKNAYRAAILRSREENK
jgi:hypothetical protein